MARQRSRVPGGRQRVLVIKFTDEEFELIRTGAASVGVTPGRLVGEAAYRNSAGPARRRISTVSCTQPLQYDTESHGGARYGISTSFASPRLHQAGILDIP